MAIAPNRAYNDPALGQAFSNLAGMFGPPSGPDLAGYANAGATKEKAARLAEYFALAKDPNFDRSTFDRLGVAVGNYAPSTSYYAVDTADATDRRGQDITAQTQKYGYDRTYAASTENNVRDNTQSGLNNAADNQRAITTNTADNQRAITTNTADNQAGVVKQLYGTPVTEGAVLPAVPKSIAELYGVPERDTFSGNVNAAPGEEITRPDGSVIKGAPKPLSETELKAAILGKLPWEDQVANVQSDIPVEKVVRDGKPVFATRSDAVGETPYVDAASQPAIQTENYITPNGQSGAAYFDTAQKLWVDTVTKQPVPAGSRTYTGQLSGDAAGTGLAPTVANNTDANKQAADITRSLDMLDMYEGLVNRNPASVGLPGLIRGTAQNAVQVAADLGAAFGKDAPQVQQAADTMRRELGTVAPELFDPSISEIDFMQGALAYSLARSENPGGEVSRQAYDRAMERVKGGGILANQKTALAAIGQSRKLLDAQLKGLETLRDPSKARTDTGYRQPGDTGGDAGVRKMERGPDGKLRFVN